MQTRRWDIDDRFVAHVFPWKGRVWLRLSEPGATSPSVGYLSTHADKDEAVPVADLVARLRDLLQQLPTLGRDPADVMMEFWPAGWENWGIGTPAPIAELVETDEFKRAMLREYHYVGPPSIRERSEGASSGTIIEGASDLRVWLQKQGSSPAEPATVTFVVDTQQRLRVAHRRSEHVACAGGQPVLSAGEMTIALAHDGPEIVAITNLSTGYCPESRSWEAVAMALDTIPLPRPEHWTSAFVFRRCTSCGQRNVVKEEWFVCAMCGADLPHRWNFTSKN